MAVQLYPGFARWRGGVCPVAADAPVIVQFDDATIAIGDADDFAWEWPSRVDPRGVVIVGWRHRGWLRGWMLTRFFEASSIVAVLVGLGIGATALVILILIGGLS